MALTIELYKKAWKNSLSPITAHCGSPPNYKYFNCEAEVRTGHKKGHSENIN
jgi:hypothetical protein